MKAHEVKERLMSELYTQPIDLQERRRRRSTNALVAISYQLEQVVKDFELDACVVATEEGLLFARAEQVMREDAEVYAAMATELLEPVLAKQNHLTHRLEATVFAHVQQLWFWGQPLYILAVGRSEAMSHLACHRAVAGIMRIDIEQQRRRLAA